MVLFVTLQYFCNAIAGALHYQIKANVYNLSMSVIRSNFVIAQVVIETVVRTSQPLYKLLVKAILVIVTYCNCCSIV